MEKLAIYPGSCPFGLPVVGPPWLQGPCRRRGLRASAASGAARHTALARGTSPCRASRGYRTQAEPGLAWRATACLGPPDSKPARRSRPSAAAPALLPSDVSLSLTDLRTSAMPAPNRQLLRRAAPCGVERVRHV